MISLTYFFPVLHLCTPLKHHVTVRFPDAFRGSRNVTLLRKRLRDIKAEKKSINVKLNELSLIAYLDTDLFLAITL